MGNFIYEMDAPIEESMIHIIEPIEVFVCRNFEARCHLCLTDSGGIQEECPPYGKCGLPQKFHE